MNSEIALDSLRLHVYIVDMAELLGTFEQVVLLSVLGLGTRVTAERCCVKCKLLSRGEPFRRGRCMRRLTGLRTRGFFHPVLLKGVRHAAGRARRYYQLTASGASALTEARTTLEQMWRGKQWPLEVLA